MKCSTAQRDILLDTSDELTLRRRRRLQAHEAGCADCRDFRQALSALSRCAAATEEDLAVRPAVLNSILRAARLSRPTPSREREWLFPVWRPLALAAAVLALAVGSWFWLAGSGPASPAALAQYSADAPDLDWNDPLDDQIDALGNILVLSAATWEVGSSVRDDSLDILAGELLELEGVSI